MRHRVRMNRRNIKRTRVGGSSVHKGMKRRRKKAQTNLDDTATVVGRGNATHGPSHVLSSVAVLVSVAVFVTPKIIYFYHQKIYLQGQSIQKINYLIKKKNTGSEPYYFPRVTRIGTRLPFGIQYRYAFTEAVHLYCMSHTVCALIVHLVAMFVRKHFNLSWHL